MENEFKMKLEKNKDPETQKESKKLVVGLSYHNFTLNDKIDILNFIGEWVKKELEFVNKIKDRKISTKTRIIN